MSPCARACREKHASQLLERMRCVGDQLDLDLGEGLDNTLAFDHLNVVEDDIRDVLLDATDADTRTPRSQRRRRDKRLAPRVRQQKVAELARRDVVRRCRLKLYTGIAAGGA